LFVDIDLGRALRRIGKIAQDGRNPLDKECAVRIIGGPVDRAARLRIGAMEIERNVLSALYHFQSELVQIRMGRSFMLDEVLPGVFAVRYLGKQFLAVYVATFVQ